MSDTPNNITKFLTAVGESIQSVEDALQQLYSERRIDTAVGAQLDIIGKVVGQARGELDDDMYRRYCRARIFTNRSNGTAEDVIKITKLILDDDEYYIHVFQEQIATVIVRLENKLIDYAIAQVIRDFLREGVAAGVKLIVEFVTATPATSFAFAPYGGGTPSTGKGFGTVLGDYDSGTWASALD